MYYILEEMYATQVLVINELSPKDSLYLYCLKKNVSVLNLVNNLATDYVLNRDNKLYTNYMNQFFYSHMKGEQFMVCEGVLHYFGTSSEEIAQKTKEQSDKFYLPQIEQLTSEVTKLKQLLEQNNIAY